MDRSVRLLVGLGVPLPEAVDAATRVPGRLLGRTGLGMLRPGLPADVTVLDDRLEIVRTLVAGVEAD
jgi:N-acetylglucosamine-6-phosphate deacetylase